MPYPTWTAGQRVTAALITAMQTQYVVKTSDQSVSNSTTLVNATDMAIAMDANATYIVRLRACYGASTTGDIKVAWTAPSGANVQRYVIAPASGVTDTTNATVQMRRRSASTGVVGGGDGTANFPVYWEDITVATTTAGTFQLQFAQNTADSTNATVLRANSYIEYVRVG